MSTTNYLAPSLVTAVPSRGRDGRLHKVTPPPDLTGPFVADEWLTPTSPLWGSVYAGEGLRAVRVVLGRLEAEAAADFGPWRCDPADHGEEYAGWLDAVAQLGDRLRADTPERALVLDALARVEARLTRDGWVPVYFGDVAASAALSGAVWS